MHVTEVATGNHFEVEFLPFEKGDLKNALKKDGWKFDWKKELEQVQNSVYKLTFSNQKDNILGLVSFMNGIGGKYLQINLLESVPYCIGKNKKYNRVVGIMLAEVCDRSFSYGYLGFVALTPKTALKKHYIETYGAIDTGFANLYFDKIIARKLIEKYLKNA